MTLSTCEVEYMSLSAVRQKVRHLQQLLGDFGLVIPEPSIALFNVNQGALVMNPVKHSRSKDIESCYHFVPEFVENGNIELVYIPAVKNIANIFKKSPRKMMLQKP